MSDTSPFGVIATQTTRQMTVREQAQAQAAAKAAVGQSASRGIAATFDEWAGTLSPSQIVALGKYRRAISVADAYKVAVANTKKKSSNPLSGIWGGVKSAGKGTVRGITSATIGTGEFVWNMGVGAVDAATNSDSQYRSSGIKGLGRAIGDAFEGSQLGHVFDSDQGSGFFQGGDAAREREEAKKKIRGVRYVTEDGRMVDYDPTQYYADGELDFDPNKLRPAMNPETNQPWVDENGNTVRAQTLTNTLGRQVFGQAFDMNVDDPRYKVWSGAVDAAAQIWGDPMNKVNRTIREVRGARNTILPASEFIEDTATIRRNAGLIEGISKTVNPKLADDFLLTRQGQALTEWHGSNTSAAEAFRMLGRDVDPEVALELAGTKTSKEAADVFRKYLGTDSGLTDARDLPGWGRTALANTAAGEKIGDLWRGSAIERTFSRQSAKVWDDVLHIDKDLSRSGRIKAIRQIDDLLATAKVAPDVRDDIVSQAIEGITTGSREGQFTAVKAMYRALGESYMANGVDPLMAQALTRFDAYADDWTRIYAIDALGHNDDFGMVATLAADGSLQYEDLTAIGPLMLSEGWQGVVDLPDYRQVKAITNKIGDLWSVGIADPENAGKVSRALGKIPGVPGDLGAKARKGLLADVDGAKIRNLLLSDNPIEKAAGRDALERVGSLRIGLAAADVLQTQVWKRAVVLRIATPLRVLGEEQARLAEAGLASSYHHPLSFFALASNHSSVGGLDILGNKWMGKPLADLTNADAVDIMEQYTQALANGTNKLLGDTGYRSLRKQIRLNAAQRVYKHEDGWTDGAAQELRRLWSDPAARLAAREMLEADVYNPRELARRFMNDPENAAAYRNLVDNGKAGIDMIDSAGNPVREVIDFTDPEAVVAYLNNYIPNRIRTLTAGNTELLRVVAKGQLGDIERVVSDKEIAKLGRVDDRAVTRIEDPDTGFGSGKMKVTWIGSTVYHPQFGEGVVTAMGSEKGTSIVKFTGSAWEDGQPTKELRKMLDTWKDDPSSPQVVKHMPRHTESMVKVGPSALRVGDFMDKTMGWFFNSLWAESTDKLSRSPAFRQFYYGKVADLLPFMDPAEANTVLRNMEAAGAGKALAPEVLDRVVAGAKKANGKFSAADIDGYAKDYALGKVQGLLYDASERSQFADALRIVFPFAEAWKEVLTRQAKLIARDPGALHTVAKVVQGARRSGVFHQDVNGNEVFTYPGSEQIVRWISGVEGQMVGKVEGLNIGISPLPGVGPALQVATSKILADNPDLDWIAAVVTPYGERGPAEAFIPGWLQKAWDAYSQDDGDGSSTYAVTLSEVIRVKIASGDYPADLAGYEKLMDDAKSDARNLTALRALGQMSAPSSPTFELKVSRDGPDLWAGELAKEFGDMMAEDPSTATERFLDLYGEDLAAFVIGKTRATVGGLDDSVDFVDWTRKNGDVLAAYPEVANYFAPTGGGLDSSAFSRQMANGDRVRRSPEEQIKAIHSLMASRRLAEFQEPLRKQIDDYVATLPPAKNRTREQEVILNNLRNDVNQKIKDYKAELATKYQGYSASPAFDVNERARQIETLYRTVDDARLKDNEVRDALAKYLDLRDQALGEIARRGAGKSQVPGLTAAVNADLADWLRRGGEHYAKQYPGFSRLWEDILSSEVTE